MIKGIIFDMDGVIADTLEFHNQAFIILFENMGIKLTPEDIRKTYGKTAMQNIEQFLDEYGLNKNPKELVIEREKIFLKITAGKINAMPGIIDLVKKLHNGKFKLAIASSSRIRVIRHILNQIGLSKYFSQIISAEDVKRSKPDPEPFLMAAHKLQLNPNECVVIEDASAGLIAAKNAGISAIIIPNKHTSGECFDGAALIVKTADALLDLDWSKMKLPTAASRVSDPVRNKL